MVLNEEVFYFIFYSIRKQLQPVLAYFRLIFVSAFHEPLNVFDLHATLNIVNTSKI